MVMAATEHSVLLGKQQVRVSVRGDGAPLLLLNGLGAPLELWEPLLAHLGGVRTIAFDTPGSGGSRTPRLPLSIRGHASLALSLLSALDCPDANVLGLSFGGMIAQEMAHIAPNRVNRLVLASTSCGWGGVPGTPAALLSITTPDRYYSRTIFEQVSPTYIGGREGSNPRFVRSQARARQAAPPDPRGYMYQLWAAAAWSSLYWLPSITAPTLVVAGEADPLVPPGNAQILSRLLPNARRHIIAGGGHLCLLERAAELAPVIDGFFAETATRED
jgi:poly(3-hydroxyalkanoate) depolymerase